MRFNFPTPWTSRFGCKQTYPLMLCVSNVLVLALCCCNGRVCSLGGRTGVVEFHISVLDIFVLFLWLRQLAGGVQRHFLVFGAREVDAGVVNVILVYVGCCLCCSRGHGHA
ncbi:hypothetical protein J4Q44_G00290130 [Coregonus suidteri]|uniref:Uncharacterized protein n=1 Tax=Coregonus suidteri TaxID=861788 RepID=A0AAN8L444_9TELE